MGRRRMLASPVSTQRNGSEATRPGSRRMSVPALRTSMTSSGSRRPSQPRAVDDQVRRPSSSTCTPEGADRGQRGQSVGGAEETR